MLVTLPRKDPDSLPFPRPPRASEDANLLRAERGLVQRCRRGDAASMRTLVERFQQDVFRVCYRLLGDKHEAEDLAQECFLRVFRSLKTWDQKRPLRPWVVSIAINRCRTALAKRARRPALSPILDINPSREMPAERTSDIRQEIDAAVDGLRREYREVFVLFHTEEMPYETIGSILRKPVGTIKTWLHRARQAVVNRLRERGVVAEVAHE
jgi:RNA polymerase sigma factor (sigma-70 family)